MSALWRIVPRDPVVVGDGRGQPALASRLPNPLPPQPTLAGFVRTAFTGSGKVEKDKAVEVLQQVSLRGPFLESVTAAGSTIWVPAPLDAGRVGEDPLTRGALLRCAPDEGVSWEGEAPDYLVHLPSKDAGGRKLKIPVRPAGWPASTPALWPWEAALGWALQEGGAEALLDQVSPNPPIQPEARVHVAIDPASGTAARQMLFSSAGWRYAEDVGLLVAVEAPSSLTPAATGVLGGEGRPARIHPQSRSLPAFDEPRWRRAWARLHAEHPGRLALRVQLLTPGCFGGWRPTAPPGLRLLATVLGAHGAVSGWSLQSRGPRAVRRLVPAGSVYVFGPLADQDAFIALSRRLWLQPLDAGQPDLANLLAAPGSDGFGLALPGLTVLPAE